MIPAKIKPFLWSYDTKKINKKRDKKRIITNILNIGNDGALKWLFKNYDKKDIRENIKKPLAGEWNNKSLNFWSLIFGVKPQIKKRKKFFCKEEQEKIKWR